MINVSSEKRILPLAFSQIYTENLKCSCEGTVNNVLKK